VRAAGGGRIRRARGTGGAEKGRTARKALRTDAAKADAARFALGGAAGAALQDARNRCIIN